MLFPLKETPFPLVNTVALRLRKSHLCVNGLHLSCRYREVVVLELHIGMDGQIVALHVYLNCQSLAVLAAHTDHQTLLHELHHKYLGNVYLAHLFVVAGQGRPALNQHERVVARVGNVGKLTTVLLGEDRYHYLQRFLVQIGSPSELVRLGRIEGEDEGLKGGEFVILVEVLHLLLQPRTQCLTEYGIHILNLFVDELPLVNLRRVVNALMLRMLTYHNDHQNHENEAILACHYLIDINLTPNYCTPHKTEIYPNGLRAPRGSICSFMGVKQFLCCYINFKRMSCGKLLNPHFIGVICFVTFNYFVYTYEYMLSLQPNNYLLLLIIFHIFFALLLWSMVRAIVGDPGRVPIYWGFFAQESENRKRRYCLLCHSFKPERCHHCSTCQRCVLNMDHHCPWIANCVGFTNRKFFMLFLFYVILTLVYSLACEIPMFVNEIIGLVKDTKQFSISLVIRAIGTLVQTAFFVVITIFFKFHVELVLSNSTTLDNLERQRNPNAGPNVYDIGSYQNFEQVFGTNWLLWLIPVSPTSSNKANGVVWPKNQ